MKAWQMRLEHELARDEAPPVLSRDLMARFAASARGGERIPASSLTHWLKQSVDLGKLDVVQRGLYLNKFRRIPGRLADAASWLKRDAVVSLNTVLGDAGVLNNPVHSVTAVVPLDTNAPPVSLGRRKTHAGIFHFFGVPRRVLEAGKPDDSLDGTSRYDHVRATPEKALVDWLYLARSPYSKRTLPPRGDMDMSLINVPRLRRLATAVGIRDNLEAWLSG